MPFSTRTYRRRAAQVKVGMGSRRLLKLSRVGHCGVRAMTAFVSDRPVLPALLSTFELRSRACYPTGARDGPRHWLARMDTLICPRL